MSEKEKIIREKSINSPLEDIFNIEAGTTIVEYEETVGTDLVETEAYDDKDNEIESQFQEIYDKALDAYTDQIAQNETLEGKYVARNSEVAAQFLNTALNAVKEKSNVKIQKDKLVKKSAIGNVDGDVNLYQNNMVLDRNELIAMFREAQAQEKSIIPVDESTGDTPNGDDKN
jgi:hypothetical protein